MKTFLMLLTLASVVFGQQFDCLKDYAAPLNKVKEQYSRQKAEFDNSYAAQRFHYEFMIIDLFPFFTCPANTDWMLKNYKAKKVYSCDNTASFLRYEDMNNEYLQVGTVYYVKDNGEIFTKTYKLYYFIRKHGMSEWVEEKSPLKIAFVRKGEDFIPKD